MDFERPVGSCFVAVTDSGEKVPCRVVWMEKSIFTTTCSKCLFHTGIYDGKGGACRVRPNSSGKCIDGRIFNECVCFIAPDKFDPEIHGVIASDDPYFHPEKLTRESVERVLSYGESYWREYVKYWAEHGKKIRVSRSS